MKMNKLLIIGGMILCSEQAFSKCSPNSTFRSLDVSMSMGRIVVRPSDPVGKILKTGTFPINSYGNTSIYTCDSGGGTLLAELSKNPTASNAGTKVYETNIPGIGIRLYRKAEGAAADASNYYPYQVALNGGARLASGQFNVEIIKTATKTGSGAVSPGRYSSYYNSTTPESPFLTSTIYGNSITIASSSCEIQGDIDKIVTLPTVNKSSFSGVGSTQGDQSFDINILCNGGENPSGYEEKNDISLNFDYQQDGSNNNVMSNILTPSNSGATGVGVQLISKYNNQTQTIKKGDNLALGTVVSNQNVQYNIPLSARYYQTSANISPGKVKAQATLNIQYQ